MPKFYVLIRFNAQAVTLDLGASPRLVVVDDEITIYVQPRDASDNLSVVYSVPVWENSDLDVGDLDVAVDGMSATFTAVEAGVTQISVSADAKSGVGVVTISNTVDIQVEP